jgi:hypothetical protein
MNRIELEKQVFENSVQNFENIKTQKKNHQTLLNATKKKFQKKHFSSKSKIK